MQTILLKITGEILCIPGSSTFTDLYIRAIAKQIKKFSDKYQLGIVMGGGNIFRGSVQGAQIKTRPVVSHYAGMLATVINALLCKDIFEQEGIDTLVLTAIECPAVAQTLSQFAIDQALRQKQCIIFAGGSGSPFFTTDTTAVVRGLQMGASFFWKGTKVAGVYTKDPLIYKDAQLIKQLSYTQALNEHIEIIDRTALLLAQEKKLVTRVFSLWEPDALIRAAEDEQFGSVLRE